MASNPFIDTMFPENEHRKYTDVTDVRKPHVHVITFGNISSHAHRQVKNKRVILILVCVVPCEA